MSVVYVVTINNDETSWSDEVRSIHRTYRGAMKSKQAIEKSWSDNELEYSESEIKIVKTKLEE